MQRPVQKAYILVSKEPAEIQRASAQTAKALSSILKSCLGPRAMQKMVLTKIGSIELTNDGNFILREMDVAHPSIRCLIELCQTQDDECGDGTTTTLIIATELLSNTVELLKDHHPVRVCNILREARDHCLAHLQKISVQMDEENLLNIVSSSVATKLCTVLHVPIPKLALKASYYIRNKDTNEMDIRTNIKIEKILGDLTESEVLDGVIIEKELVHSQMKRRVENPKILLLDTPLEYKKGESVTNYEFSRSTDFSRALELEEEQIRRDCKKIIEIAPDIVLTEKGMSDLALSIFYENNIVAFRRVKRSDLIRLAKSTGGVIMSRVEDLETRHLGTAGLYEYIKINTDHYCKISRCKDPKAVTVVLRGPSKDLITELERNFMDAIKVARNVLRSSSLVPGGGASEMGMAISMSRAEGVHGLRKSVFEACAKSFRTIPSILSVNSGARSALDALQSLEEAQEKNLYAGINGISGEVADMKNIVMEPIIVKEQCVKSSFEAVMQLLRVDGIIESRAK